MAFGALLKHTSSHTIAHVTKLWEVEVKKSTRKDPGPTLGVNICFMAKEKASG